MPEFDFSHRIVNNRDELIDLMNAVEAYGRDHRFSPELTYAAELAVEELILNTISYGCGDGKPHHIELRMAVEDDCLHMEIEDDAAPFNPLQAPEPTGLHGPAPEHEGGLGIFLVRECMDEIEYQEKKGGNLLILKKTNASN